MFLPVPTTKQDADVDELVRDPLWNFHLGYKTLFNDKVTDIPRSIRAPAKTDKRSAVSLVEDSVGYKEICHGLNDLGKGWGIVRLVLWRLSDTPRL